MTVRARPMLTARFTQRFGGDVVICGQLQHACEPAGVTVLLGPSGCGKTTVLRAIAGLARPDEGRIALGDETWFDAQRRTFVPPQHRNVGMLFQDYALFPHMTVERNIAYGMRHVDRTQIGRMLGRFDLSGLSHRYPAELSGGQQQRVALARAVAAQPRLLLLDEPLSALDAGTRQATRLQLRAMLREAGVPVVLVTHDHDDVVALADHVVVMTGGRVLQAGTIHDVFNRPANTTVAQIVGMDTVLAGRMVRRSGDMVELEVGGRTLWSADAIVSPGPVQICIRAQDVVLDDQPDSHVSARNRLQATITAITPVGAALRISLDCGFPLWTVVTHAAREQMQLQPGGTVYALIKATAILVFPHHDA